MWTSSSTAGYTAWSRWRSKRASTAGARRPGTSSGSGSSSATPSQAAWCCTPGVARRSRWTTPPRAASGRRPSRPSGPEPLSLTGTAQRAAASLRLRYPASGQASSIGSVLGIADYILRKMQMTVTATNLLTADELLALYSQGVRGELIRGVLTEVNPVGQEHGEIVTSLVLALGNFVKPRGLGRLTASDAGVWLERDPDTVREPDIAFFSAERIPPGVRVTGYSEIAPDLVVEIVSPSDSRREVHDKARMWLSHGVRLVWVVHPDDRTVDVHRPGQPVVTRTAADALDGADVLPGFTYAVSAMLG
ncbi:MAG: Uma2 family endonuclease [Acidimicrobiia bacterium]|nr:Uma2 family endonuclease [Acidimicrobiia bacterium]